VVDDAYPEWRGRASATASRRRLSLSELDECLGGFTASFAHQNCPAAVAIAVAAAFSSTLPRAAVSTTSAPPPSPSSRER
jgi:hypothetical protein